MIAVTVLCVTLRWCKTCAMWKRSTPASPMYDAAVRRKSCARKWNVFSNHRHTCVADRAKKAAAILCKGGVS